MRILAAILLAGALFAPKPNVETDMTRASREFLAALPPELRERAVLPFESDQRTVWSYTPGVRPGVAWRDLNREQQEAAHRLLRATLGDRGAAKAEAVRQLEPILREMERGNPGRDTERYWIMFFGEPGNENPWTLRYEGHHLSLSFTHVAGTLVSSTPQFLGANPAEVPAHSVTGGHPQGTRVLAKEQDLAFLLAESLTATQRAKAQLARTAPADIITGNTRRAAIEGREGLSYRELDAQQRDMLRNLIAAHAEVQSEAEQRRRLNMIEAEGYDEIVFAWMGPIERRDRHYYRIQGNTFLIEYDNTQRDGNHIHTVWRRLDGDWGVEDPLADHYRYGHHRHEHRE